MRFINKEVTEGVKINPTIEGTWYWDSDSRLLFTPKDDWPAGITYTIQFDADFFAPNTKMQTLKVSFTTHVFEAKINEFKFYQDPNHEKLQQAVATIQFNYPVNPESLAKETTLALQEENQADSTRKPFKFTIDYDEHKRIAYLRSEPITVLNVARYLVLTINKSLKSASSSDPLNVTISKNLLIPDSSNYFKITQSGAAIIRNMQDRPEQILTVESSLGTTEAEINKSLHVYVLPANYPATRISKEKINYDWKNPGEVTADILAQSKPLVLNAIPADRNFATLHSFKFFAKSPGYLYLKVDKGTKGIGDYALNNNYQAVIKVPEYPKEINFLHKGALLALSGEKKLSVLVRGLPAVKFQIARVLPDNINQLVTQTQGNFNNPSFINQSFDQQNISEIFSEIQQFNSQDPAKQQYSVLNLEKYLMTPANTTGMKGLFLLQAIGWDVTSNTALEVKTSRLILITDNGLIVKDNNDNSHDIFVQSIITGAPVANAEVVVLGKNGLPVLSQQTDSEGHAYFPSLKDFIEQREPVVYLVKNGDDLAFIPYSNYNRQLNFSRFDIGGLYSNNQELANLRAFIFSDRGVYRPGDSVNLGVIIKQAYAHAQPGGLPLQITITDSRGNLVYDQKISLDNTGLFSINFKTNTVSPTGQYTVNVYTVKDNHSENLLGSTSIRVAEFLPDRMRITTKFSQDNNKGWASPNDLMANVDLWNLYGAPAENRRVIGKINLLPQALHFDEYPNFIFVDPLLDQSKPPKSFNETLAEVTTNSLGNAQFKLNLDRFEKATYQLTFYAEGFEAEGGRSVSNQATILVSPLSSIVGFKADGDLTYIKQADSRTIDYIAIDPTLTKISLNDLKIQLASLHPVTTLVKKPDGTYQYESIIQSTVIKTSPFTIDQKQTSYTLPTDKIGDFSLSILDKSNVELSRVKYSVVGASQQPIAKNAELTIKLNKDEYLPDEDIELQITAPYIGSGLITIERDKVYATQWFKTDTTRSVQHIKIPSNFQGNGYINVTFMRDWNSPEIFISPLSYSVAPFKINPQNHEVHINLNTTNSAMPGDMLTIDYSTDKPGKIIVFAVDEGILQVARFTTPDPIAFFFQKYALEVNTQQIIDEILPKYIRERELSAAGGDGSDEQLSNHLNPFKRKTDLPVVYWSGILDSDSSTHQLTYQIPDYFNGSLRIMAVAVTDEAIGSTDKQVEVKGNFVITPNVPTFVAPNDEFEITASIANNVKDSGDKALINVQITTSPELEIIDSNQIDLPIQQNHEQTVRFKLRARAQLGAANITFFTRFQDKFSTLAATLSVRPAATYMTSVTSGVTQSKLNELVLNNQLYPNYRQVDVIFSDNPLILVTGLSRYLENFPYGCTEQLVSKAMPLLASIPQTELEPQQIKNKITATIQMLMRRQMTSGGFSYWPDVDNNENDIFATVYAMHFLTEARAKGYVVTDDAFFSGISYLKELATKTPTNIESARNQAYAIYLLTRNELVTSNYLTHLIIWLEKSHAKAWKNDILSAYLAATYQLLKNDSEASQLIDGYKPEFKTSDNSDFYTDYNANAQYLYLIALHFPERLYSLNNSLLFPLINAMNNEINTLFASYTSLALSAYKANPDKTDWNKLTVYETTTTNQTKQLQIDKAHKTAINSNVLKISINNPEKQNYFYQLIEMGFDKNSISTANPLNSGIEINKDYLTTEKDPIDIVPLGAEIEVHIRVRLLENSYLSNIAIVDLLPGGFEVVSDSISKDTINYYDIREDRVIFFANLTNQSQEIVYRIKATNAGKFIAPAVFAESMYNPTIKARGKTREIIVH